MEEQEKQEITAAQETEAMKAMKEAYEEQIAAIKKQLADEKKEHAKQIKDLMLGRTEELAPEEEEEVQEKTEVEKAVENIVAKIKKQRGIK